MGWIFSLLVSWIVNAMVLAGVAWVLADVTFDTTRSLFVAAAIFGILNTILKPIVKFITLPIAILTLGIAWFFVAMLMLAITDWLVGGFEIEGFWTYVWATIIVWAINLVLDILMRPWREPTIVTP
jgi:putative membrane protein